MARVSYGVTLRTTLAQNGGFVMGIAAAGAIPSQAAVEAAVALLEADGASPTQAHVTALRGVWNTLVTGLNAHNTGDAVLDIDNATLTSQSAVRAALRELQQAVAGSGLAG